MMGYYLYKKWFFDIRKDVYEYLVFFITMIKLGHGWKVYLQIHNARSSNKKEGSWQYNSFNMTLHPLNITEAGIRFKEGYIELSSGNCDIFLKSEDLQMSLKYSGTLNTVKPLSAMLMISGRRELSWYPVLLSAMVSGDIRHKDNTYHFKSSKGYHDEVRTNILPWKMPVRDLIWGRIIHKDVNLSFTLISIRESRDYIIEVHVRIGDNYFNLKDLRLEVVKSSYFEPLDLNYPEEYHIYFISNEIRIRISVRDHIIAIVNDFMDYRKDYGRFITWILKRVSRNPRGIKFVSKADIRIEGRDQNINIKKIDMVDEFVRFGS